ncbi:E3 ubiquitin-protein ligase TRIM21-like [Brachyistius frenatus]|uniref:E3 ubiquitin-protein ligase TRIM21-like n=1 Tax=Brachyistius frenatus TaxID=100188 RepID=UPI0037E71B50
MEIITPLVGPQQHFLQMGANPFNTHQALDFTAGPKPSLMPLPSLTFPTQADPAAADTTVRESNESLFETPPRSPPTTFSPGKVRRALDFSTATQQVEHHLKPPTTTAREIVKHPNETEKEDEREAQKRRKARQDRTKADLQQKIHTGETKVAEVRSSVKACKGNLDAEWLEINNVFSEVMREVEEARQKALQPLEERRRKVKREAKDLVQKLQREIDALKKTIDELDKNTDLQVSPPTGLHESQDWSDVSVDTSLSFGSLRSATSTMMKQIHQKLEKLSSVELKRIPTFAVDVKLDPASAHRCLVLSDDGKEVRDGGKKSEVPDPPERFDLFGSVVALNSVASGRSYWEVEVRNKSDWDLGVARRDAKRKGKLSLNPDEGYWVAVHYEGGKYAALAAPPVSLSLEEKPEKVGVFVDYEEGLVSFYDVTTRSHIYSFTECSFGDEVFPYFSPHLKENDKNAAALIISAVPKQ